MVGGERERERAPAFSAELGPPEAGRPTARVFSSPRLRERKNKTPSPFSALPRAIPTTMAPSERPRRSGRRLKHAPTQQEQEQQQPQQPPQSPQASPRLPPDMLPLVLQHAAIYDALSSVVAPNVVPVAEFLGGGGGGGGGSTTPWLFFEDRGSAPSWGPTIAAARAALDASAAAALAPISRAAMAAATARSAFIAGTWAPGAPLVVMKRRSGRRRAQ